jgi:hypothetical protein
MRKKIYFLLLMTMCRFLSALDLTSSLLLLDKSLQEVIIPLKSIGFKSGLIPKRPLPQIPPKEKTQQPLEQKNPQPTGQVPPPPPPQKPIVPQEKANPTVPINPPEIKKPSLPSAEELTKQKQNIEKATQEKATKGKVFSVDTLIDLTPRKLKEITTEDIKKFDKNQVEALLKNNKIVLEKDQKEALINSLGYKKFKEEKPFIAAMLVRTLGTQTPEEEEEEENSEWEID